MTRSWHGCAARMSFSPRKPPGEAGQSARGPSREQAQPSWGGSNPVPGPHPWMMRSEPSSSSAPAKGLVFAGPGTGKTRLLTSWVAGQIDTGLCDPRAGARPHFHRSRSRRNAPEAHGSSLAHGRRRSPRRLSTPSASACFARATPARHRLQRFAARLPPGDAAGLETPSRARIAAERMQRYYEGMEEPDEALRGTHHGLRKLVHGHRRRGRLIPGDQGAGRLPRIPEFLSEQRRKFSTSLPSMSCRTSTSPSSSCLSALGETAEALLCIGDPDQAIYGFRGSDRALFFQFRDQPGTRVFFRLTSIIVLRQPSCAPRRAYRARSASPELPALRAREAGRRSHSRVSRRPTPRKKET